MNCIQAEHAERMEKKRQQYEESERSQSTFMPEISMVSHQMDRSVDSLMTWQKQREQRQHTRKVALEKEQRSNSPFRPTLSKKTEQIVRRMDRSSNDGCRSTARANGMPLCWALLELNDGVVQRGENTELQRRSKKLALNLQSTAGRLGSTWAVSLSTKDCIDRQVRA